MNWNRCVKFVFGVPLLFLLCVGCQVHIGGCSVGQRALFEKTVELQQPMALGRTVDVKTSSGSIKIEGADTDQCQVVARISVRAKSEIVAAEIAEQIKVLISETGSGLEIRSEQPRLNHVSISISYDVTVPNRTSVVCRSASGSLKVIEIEGDVDARTSSGSVRCENIAGHSATLDTSSGSVHLNDAKLMTCRLHTSSGSIHSHRIDCADIHANASSGSITVVCIETCPPEMKVDLLTSSGSVNLTVPQHYSGQVDLLTSSGSVRTDLPVTIRGKISKRHLVGTVGQGAGKIRLKSSSGSVTLKTP